MLALSFDLPDTEEKALKKTNMCFRAIFEMKLKEKDIRYLILLRQELEQHDGGCSTMEIEK